MWETEVTSKVRPGFLAVPIYHGANRAKDPILVARYVITWITMTTEY